MKIRKISTAVIEANFDWTLVKVETDEGITGYGEAFLGPGLTAIIKEYESILLGEDPTSIDRVVRRLHLSSAHAGPGLVCHAIGGIETALLDLLGKKYGMPVWQLLGGKYRDDVRIYADCHAGDALESIGPLLAPRTPAWMGKAGEAAAGSNLKVYDWDAGRPEALTGASYAAQAVKMVERGFRLLKFDVDVPSPYESDAFNRDLSPPEVEFAASLARAVRDAVGEDVGLAIDCHWKYGVASAVALARALESCGLVWLEDPVPPENLQVLAEVQRNTRTPLATGENHYHRIDFQRLITEAGLRLLAPDVQKMGLWMGKKLADLADLHAVNLTWHNISGPLGTMAGVHLCAATPNFLALEWHAASVPFFDELVKGGGGAPLIRGGKVRVPDAPGLGIEIDEDVAYKYRKPGEPFFA